MRGPLLWLLLLAAVPAPLAAQRDADSQPRAVIREKIERRFAERVKAELDLTDEQAAKLKTVATEHGGRRRELRQRERELRAALDAQITDNATANQDSVAKLTRELLDLRVRYAENWRQEMSKLGFLTPVQRAKLLVLREQLLQKVHEMRGHHEGFRHRRDGH